MSTIFFETELLKIGDWSILRLPENASAQLPSRGLALVEGMINGFHSKIVLEPDGKGWPLVSGLILACAKPLVSVQVIQ